MTPTRLLNADYTRAPGVLAASQRPRPPHPELPPATSGSQALMDDRHLIKQRVRRSGVRDIAEAGLARATPRKSGNLRLPRAAIGRIAARGLRDSRRRRPSPRPLAGISRSRPHMCRAADLRQTRRVIISVLHGSAQFPAPARRRIGERQISYLTLTVFHDE